jgi:hypothetical protein
MVTWTPDRRVDGPQNHLVFYTSVNVRGKNDAKGAFIPEAEHYAKLHGIPEENMFGIPCPRLRKDKRRERVLDTVSGFKNDIESIAMFGHGWPSGIQFGFNRKNHTELLDAIVDKCTGEFKLILFACLAAENDVREREIRNIGPGTDGGFADVFRDSMVRYGINFGHVDAHKTAGHTSWNPYLVRFLCEDVDDPEFGAIGGGWLVEPRSQFWGKWVKKLRARSTGLRYRFPFMDELEIKTELAKLTAI